MKRALIIGASGGIGAAIAGEVRAQGGEMVGVSRSTDGLDVTDESSVCAVLGALHGHFDLVFVATGALEVGGARPEKTVRAVTAQAMMDQFAVNAIGPALIFKHVLRLLPKDRPVAIAALSARVGSIADNRAGGWTSYRASKAALNQVVRTTAIEIARTHPKAVCVALHPGTVATALTRTYLARHAAVPPARAAQNLLAVIDGLRPEQTGGFFDWSGKVVPW